jgi:hypothetical protein
MKMMFRLPDWLQDPEFFWQKVSIGLTAAVLLLAALCFQLRAERQACRQQVRELTALNDRQRTTIGQLGGELGQVRSAMSNMVTRMDELLSASKEQTELAAALLAETPATETQEEPVIACVEAEPIQTDSGTEQTTGTQTLTADFNGDGIVEWRDFEIFSQSWGKDGKLRVDMNDDREVTWKDFQIFAAEWMKTEVWYKDKRNG